MDGCDHASHARVGHWARAGGAADDVGIESPGQVLKLHSWDRDHASAPGLILVTLSHQRPAQHKGRFAVYATLRWTTGKGQMEAAIDVPAGGTCVAVAGADGLEVTAVGEGDRDAREVTVRVEGCASWVEAAHPRAARRTVVVSPADLGDEHPIPAFAREVRVLWPGGVAGSLTFVTHAYVGAEVVLALPAVPLAASVPVPQGAQGFIVQLADAPTRPVHTVWELSL